MRRANIIKRINWDNSDKGYMTVEASFIVPVLFFAFFLAILGLIFTYERGLILSNEYEGLYTVPLICVRDNLVSEYLSGVDYSKGTVYGEMSFETDYFLHRASCKGSLDIKGTAEVSGAREIGGTVDRLRRWRLYDDTFKE